MQALTVGRAFSDPQKFTVLEKEIFGHALAGDGGQAAQVVVVGAVGDGFEIFRVAPMSYADSLDFTGFCHLNALFFAYGGAV